MRRTMVLLFTIISQMVTTTRRCIRLHVCADTASVVRGLWEFTPASSTEAASVRITR